MSSSSVRPTIPDSNVVRSCSRKRRYLSKREAKREAKGLAHRRYGGDITIYECPHCGGWHLAHRHR